MCGFRFANVLQATSPLSLLQGVLRCILQVYLVRLVANRIDRRGKRLRLLRDAFFGAPHRRLLGAPLPHPISMAFWAPRAHCRRRPRATLGRGLVRGRRLLHMPSIPFHELKGGRPPAFQHGIDIPNARRIEEVVVFIIGLLDSIDPGQTLYLVMIASSQIGRRAAARASLL